MREILFRGKRTDNDEWAFGFFTKSPSGNVYITETVTGCASPKTVDPDTVGQFTGLTDKNGKKIFEGDIVRGRHWTSYNDKNPENFHLWRVDWNEKSGLIIFVDSPTSKARLSIHDFADFGEVEIIGNIHDNKLEDFNGN